MSNDSSSRFIEPWFAIDGSHTLEAASLAAELQRELMPPHPLFGETAEAIARRYDCDDVLFQIGGSSGRFAVVHLTWTAKPERSPQFPWTRFFESLEEFAETRMKDDALEFGRAI